jgi:uncharacterized protein (UPF0218 family)
LKAPLGTLLRGSFNQTLNEFKKIVKTKKPSMIVSVGDALSEALLENRILPKVLIIDYKVMRKLAVPFVTENYETMYARNNPGTISDEAWAIVDSAVKHSSRVKIVVEGEEDLLALVAILSAPEGAWVVYGQPHEGMVVVEVTAQKKDEIRKIVDSMEHIVSKS